VLERWREAMSYSQKHNIGRGLTLPAQDMPCPSKSSSVKLHFIEVLRFGAVEVAIAEARVDKTRAKIAQTLGEQDLTGPSATKGIRAHRYVYLSASSPAGVGVGLSLSFSLSFARSVSVCVCARACV
jgi:hypothetical protein